jgi:uncharacterized membrane protein
MDGLLVALTVVAVWALVDWDAAVGPWLLAGGAVYLIGAIGLTVAYHVPRNDALAAVTPDDSEAAGRWTRYVAEWTRANHLRAAASLAAAAMFTLVAPGRVMSIRPSWRCAA